MGMVASDGDSSSSSSARGRRGSERELWNRGEVRETENGEGERNGNQ